MCISKLEEFQQTSRAIELIHLGVRNTIICLMTGISNYSVRRLSRELLGHSQKSGPLPDPTTILQRSQRATHASIFLNAHQHVTGGQPIIEAESFIRAYKLYSDLVEPLPEAAQLDANECWVLARAYRSGIIERRKCRECKVWFVYDPGLSATHSCPACGDDAGKSVVVRRNCARPVRPALACA